MSMDMGSTLRQRKEQFLATRDENGTWRVLDTWHPALERIGPDDDVPDNSPAVTLVSEGKFIELIRAATQLGFLENAAVKGESTNNSEEVESLKKELGVLKTEMESLVKENIALVFENKNLKEAPPKVPMSENFLLKEKTINALLKIIVSDEISKT